MERERDEAMRIAALRAEDGYLVEEKQGLAKIQRLFREHNSERIRQTVNSLHPTPLRVWSGMRVSADGPVWLAVVVMSRRSWTARSCDYANGWTSKHRSA